MAALAVVEELIWIVPFNSTQVSDCSVSGDAPTVNVPFKCGAITLFRIRRERGIMLALHALSIEVDEIVRSVRLMPFSIVVVCWFVNQRRIEIILARR